MTELTLVQQIAEEFEAHTPVCVLQLYTREYAPDHGFSAGLRDIENYVVEPCTAQYSDVQQLQRTYGEGVHYILDDDSVDEQTWCSAATAYLDQCAALARAAEVHEVNSIVEQAINALQSGDFGTATAHVAALALRGGNVPTCKLDDLADFAAGEHPIVAHINGANWVVQP